MEPFTFMFAIALADGLRQVGDKLIAPLMEPAKEQIEERALRGYKNAKNDQALQDVIAEALESAGAPQKDDDKMMAWAKEMGIARLQTPKAEALRRQVARAVIGHTQPGMAPPDDLIFALRWPPSKAGDLTNLLTSLRQGLVTLDDWRPLIAYADEQAEKRQLHEMLTHLADLSDVVTQTEAGNALRVVIHKLGISPEDASQIEHSYRQRVADQFRMHIVQGLAQVERTIRLPLEDIYHELGLIPLSTRKDQDEELARYVQAENSERLQSELRHVDERISHALSEERRLVIVGKPGSGKTTSLKFMTYMLTVGEPGAARLGLDAPYLPIYVRLADYAKVLQGKPTLSLESFLIQYLEDKYPDVCTPHQGAFLQAALQNGGCMILLDGLDEVGDVGDKLLYGQTLRQKVLREVQDFAEQRCRQEYGNRLVVTSRWEGYQRGDLAGFAEVELSLLRLPDEVEDFLLRWFTAYTQEHDPALTRETAQNQAQTQSVNPLMDSIMQSDSVKLLAVNPLLLTILAIIHETRDTPLPNRRVELYRIVAETLVTNWRKSQTKQVSRIYDVVRPTDIYYMMSCLAYWLHENELGGTMPIEKWRVEINKLLYDYGEPKEVEGLVEEFLHHAREEAGLLTERSDGQIGFFHLTLEEYLAAVEIARQGTDRRLEMLSKHWMNPNWKEVILLTAGELDQRGNRTFLETYLSALVNQETDDKSQYGWPAFLAARALADIGELRIGPRLRETIRLAAIEAAQDINPTTKKPDLSGRVNLSLRADAADALDELGYLPKDLHTFVSIPDPHSPDYLIAKYPITNIQYQRFLEASDFGKREYWIDFPKFGESEKGYEEVGDWGEEGWKWLQTNWRDEKKVYPRFWDDSRFGIARGGVPVVGVNWYEANAYCKWLLAHWEELLEGEQNPGMKPGRIRLPTEREWIAAAGGADPKERYPWDRGREVTQEEAEILRRANVAESGIGRTTPVGMYPLGVSPHGVWDMGGNIWEWQANYSSDSQKYLAWRGGSWGSVHLSARLSDRNGDHPADHWGNLGFRVVALPSERS